MEQTQAGAIALNVHEKLEFAKWVLERNLQWVAAAEVKAGAITTLGVAMLGGMAAALGAAHAKSSMLIFWAVLASATLFIALVHIGFTILPRLAGPKRSMIFFGLVAKTPRAEYARELLTASKEELLADLMDQIHRNAEIATQKHRLVRRAAIWSLISVPSWLGALYLALTYM